MDRQEVVAALREAYEKGGIRLLSAIADDIREHGQLHDPEFVLCLECGTEYEPEPGALNGPKQTVRCPTCQHEARNAAARRYQRRRSTT